MDRDNLENRNIEECIILKRNIRKLNEFMYCIEIFQGRRMRRELVNAVMSSKVCIIRS